MRLADFILANVEPILGEWEAFARSVWPKGMTAAEPAELRDHAADILRATARDMRSEQSDVQQADKSKGDGGGGSGSDRLDGASGVHAVARVNSGLDLLAVVAEYRALRGSVVRLWRASAPNPDARDLADLTRFNESIDQSLAEAVRSYTQRIDRSRQMFLAILGHDLRNPLNAMMMSAAALYQAARLDDDAAAMASTISSSAAAMARMIGDLLDFTAAGAGADMPLSPGPTDLRPLCLEVVGEMRVAYPARTFRFAPSADLDLTGRWDAARLRQVVSNLLGNAVQHGAEHELIELSAQADAARVSLVVCNGGPPIPPASLPTIFDPLVREAPMEGRGRRRRAGSIGLGLYIAREIVRGHGGSIDIASTPADGTTFTVHLPRAGPPVV